jgi:hypothetical protein
MFCPNCGNQAAADQKFCRSCGMNLQKVAPALIEHMAETGSDQLPVETSDVNRRRVRRNVLWGTVTTGAGVAYGIVGKVMIHEDMVTGAGALVAVGGLFWLIYTFLSVSFGLAPATRSLSQPEGAPDAKTTGRLTPEMAPGIMPSVTERTTDLLANASDQLVGRKRSDELSV